MLERNSPHFTRSQVVPAISDTFSDELRTLFATVSPQKTTNTAFQVEGLKRSASIFAGWSRAIICAAMEHLIDIASESALTAAHEGSEYVYALDEAGNARILRCITHEPRVRVPDYLGEHPVVAIAHAAFAALDSTEALELSAGIADIGWNAFAGCKRLRRIVFPSTLDHVDKTWLADCGQLTDVVLPAAAETISADFLKSIRPRRIVIGRGTRVFDAPPFWSSCLREVAVDAANPFLSTDGCCLYTRDGATLLKCLIEDEECRVQPGCRTIGEKAFAFNTRLTRIDMPDSVECIDTAAFIGSALATFTAPPHLHLIGERAFARCVCLRTVELNNELEAIENAPFLQCDALERLEIPASVRELGRGMIAETPLTASGPAPTFAIDPANPTLFIESGVLYKRGDTGLVLVDALDGQMTNCIVRPGTTVIGADAFSQHAALEQVELPEGLTKIGANAFNGCEHLTAITLPSTLRSIGTRGLFNTALATLGLPAALEHLGSCALAVDCTDGRVPAKHLPTLRDVQIDPANEHFFLESGILCERMSGYARAVLYVGPDTDVAIPRIVTEIGPYAFAGVRDLSRLALHGGITRVGTLGLALAALPHVLEVELAERETGATRNLRIHPIRDSRGLRALRNAINGERLDVPRLADGMDRMAPYARNPFERVRYMVERLADPYLLSDTMRTNYDLTLKRSLSGLCVAAAAHGWHAGFDALAALGYLNAETIVSVIDAVNAAGHIAATIYLIHLKNRLWGAHWDYSL